MSLASFLRTRRAGLLRAWTEQLEETPVRGGGPDVDWLTPHLPLVWAELVGALEGRGPLALEGVGREVPAEAWVAALGQVRQALLRLLEGHPCAVGEVCRLHALLDGLACRKVARRTACARAEVSAAAHALAGAREEAAWSEARLAGLLDSVPQLVFLKDVEGHYLFANRRWETLLGLSPQQVQGRSDEELFGPEVALWLRAYDAKSLASPTPLEGEVELGPPEGRRPFLVTQFPLYDTEGRPFALCGVATDISGRRRQERDARFLAEAATWLASAQDVPGALVQVAQLAAAHLADWCLVDLVQQEELVRLAVVHAPGVEAQEGVAFRHPPRLSARHGPGAVARTGIAELVPAVAEAQLRAVAHDTGHLQALQRAGIHSYLSVPLRARGRALGALTFLRTHTPGRLGERDLRLAEELARSAALALDNARLLAETREAVRARNELLAVVSHDLKNPVHAILMATTLLLRTAGQGEQGERVRRQTEAIQRASERMRHLIHDLLDAASVEARALNVSRSPQEVEALAREAVEMLEPLAQEKQQRLTLCVTQGTGRVAGDRERLLQVLGNLLGNALKFTPPGGDIRLEVASGQEGMVLFRVQDAGPGIAPEDLPHLFDRYWQRAGGRTGAGLGLYIARGIVEAHGGTLSVESRPGEGACFTFALPRAD